MIPTSGTRMIVQPQMGNHFSMPMNFSSPFQAQMQNPFTMMPAMQHMQHMGQMNQMNHMNQMNQMNHQMSRVPPMMSQMPFNYFMENPWMYYFMNQSFPNLNCQYQAPVIDLEA